MATRRRVRDRVRLERGYRTNSNAEIDNAYVNTTRDPFASSVLNGWGVIKMSQNHD
jgi:hypothetical protein